MDTKKGYKYRDQEIVVEIFEVLKKEDTSGLCIASVDECQNRQLQSTGRVSYPYLLLYLYLRLCNFGLDCLFVLIVRLNSFIDVRIIIIISSAYHYHHHHHHQFNHLPDMDMGKP